MNLSLQAGETPEPPQVTICDTADCSWPTLAMIYPSHNPQKPVAVAVQKDGVLTTVQIDLAHASGLLSALASIIQHHLESERRR